MLRETSTHGQLDVRRRYGTVRCIVNIAKIVKQSTLKALKKALFSEPVHEKKEPQLGRHGSAPP